MLVPMDSWNDDSGPPHILSNSVLPSLGMIKRGLFSRSRATRRGHIPVNRHTTMKPSCTFFFIASLAKGVYAASSLRSRQNLGHDAEENFKSHVNKPAVDMKEQSDASRLLEGNHEIIMDSDPFLYELTAEEAEEFIQEMDALQDEATMTEPDFGNYNEWNQEYTSKNEQYIPEERMKDSPGSIGDDDDWEPSPKKTNAATYTASGSY